MNIKSFYLFILFCFLSISFSSFAYSADESTFFGSIGQLMQNINDFLFGIPDMLGELLANFISWLSLWAIKLKLFFLTIAYQTAKHMIQDLNLNTLIDQAFTNIPPNIGYYLNKLKIPDCIAFLLQCSVTRYVLNFMGIK